MRIPAHMTTALGSGAEPALRDVPPTPGAGRATICVCTVGDSNRTGCWRIEVENLLARSSGASEADV